MFKNQAQFWGEPAAFPFLGLKGILQHTRSHNHHILLQCIIR